MRGGLLAVFLLQAIGWGLFGQGFFLQKQPLDGIADFSSYPATIGSQTDVGARYDRLVFVVIDALRADFLFDLPMGDKQILRSTNMPFLDSLVRSGAARSYIGQAQAPTVTLPRIKAILSGSVPSFWDFVENFDSSALQEDSLLHQLRAKDWKVSFCGDDTWLRLFPPSEGFFVRWEGTTSFFVSDTVEVDTNVTRCMLSELERPVKEQADALFLHYLGLDHIGHYQGPRSALLPPKLREMDQVIARIVQHISVSDQSRCIPSARGCRTLLVVTGDHGMNELGNHGGSSLLEINTGLILIDIAWHGSNQTHQLQSVNQVDLIPTLSILLGLPIPQNSLGRLIRTMVFDLPVSEQLRAFQVNAEQLMRVIRANRAFWREGKPVSPSIQKIVEEMNSLQESLAAIYSTAATTNDNQIVSLIDRYDCLIEATSQLFLELLTEYDIPLLLEGIVVLAIGVAVSVGLLLSHCRSLNLLTQKELFEPILFFLGFVIFLASLFTSSLVEEEHQTWYFLLTTASLIYSFRAFLRDNSSAAIPIALVVIQRLMRSWNMSGNKWLHLMDIGDSIDQSHEAFQLLFGCLLAPFLFFAYSLRRQNDLKSIWWLTLCQTTFCCLTLALTKAQQINSPILSYLISEYWLLVGIQASYLLILASAFVTLSVQGNISQKVDSVRQQLVLLLLFLHKPRNQLLIILMVGHSILFRFFLKRQQGQELVLNAIRSSFFALWWIKASYFVLGNSNSLASIDIAGAYTGTLLAFLAI